MVVDIIQISCVIVHQLHNYTSNLIHYLSPKQNTLINERYLMYILYMPDLLNHPASPYLVHLHKRNDRKC